MPWNPNVLAAFYRRGIVEQLGSGTLRMIRLCGEAGLGTPVFTANAVSVTCDIPRDGYWLGPDGSSVVVSEAEAQALRMMVGRTLRRSELVDSLGIAELSARDLLERLRNVGLIHVSGVGRGSSWSLGER